MIKLILKAFLGTMMYACFWIICLIYRDIIININDIGFRIVLVLMLFSSMVFLTLSAFGENER